MLMYDDAGISRQAELSRLKHAVETELGRGPFCVGLKRSLRERLGAGSAAARSRELAMLRRMGCALCLLAVLLIGLHVSPMPGEAGMSVLIAVCGLTLLFIHRMARLTRHVYLHAVLQDVRLEQLAFDNRRLSALSVTDALTGAANRRHLEQALRTLCGEPPCGDFLLLADIDFFKHFNDCHGHIAGDACLREVVAAIRSQLRRSDLVARFGGEEFAIILPRTTYSDALATAERIRVGVANQRMRVNGQNETVTVSIGIAERAGAMTPCTLVSLADRALYAAKHAGRNRIFCAEQTPHDVAA
jgi:diguanylate cyclase (GGDEF)-like protein